MRNKFMVCVGVVLIAAGGLILFFRGIPYTSRAVVIDVGPLKATAESDKTWPVSPIVGGLAIAGGVALVVIGARRT